MRPSPLQSRNVNSLLSSAFPEALCLLTPIFVLRFRLTALGRNFFFADTTPLDIDRLYRGIRHLGPSQASVSIARMKLVFLFRGPLRFLKQP